jgi:hypothetical protein
MRIKGVSQETARNYTDRTPPKPVNRALGHVSRFESLTPSQIRSPFDREFVPP